jgi:prepilin-type N-terminal cleavage/methylation domain-containing protein
VLLEPSLSRLRRLRSSRGFTLIELMVVVLIIAITAALAVPTLVGQMRERRSRDAAQQIALLYSGARMRAMGRGGAVLVRYSSATGFDVFDSIEGAQAVARMENACVAAPGSGCLSTNWGDAANLRQVSEFNPATNLTVQALNHLGAATNDLRVCFTPSGRSFASYTSTDPTAAMAGSPSFTVKLGTTGLARRVALLPNGNARLAL